jgi:hypothetical protein
VYDQPSPSGHRFGTGLIAFLAVLAIAAGAVGYFGARSVLAANETPTAGGTNGPSNTPTTGHGGGASSGGGTATGSTQSATGGSRPATPPDQVAGGDPSQCPQPTLDAVAHAGLDNSLTVLLYIRVHRDGEYDSEIWICQNPEGLLVYQGHVLRKVLETATSDSSLLLIDGVKGTVVADPDGSYVATNPVTGGRTTEYHVSRTALVIIDEPGDKNRQVYPVLVAKP